MAPSNGRASEPTCNIGDSRERLYRERNWSIADDADENGRQRITIAREDGKTETVGFLDGLTGNIYTEAQGETPVILIVGNLSGQTGQVTIRQDDGSYRRFSRWDRVKSGTPAQPAAIVRTLPQCGCGGALGMPKLFDSFAEMSVYFLLTFG